MKVAFVFPGQGSQAVGMLDAWADNSVVTSILKQADEALNQNLSQIIQEGPAETLNLTSNTQPAMLTASYAIYQAWLAAGGRQPDLVAGHSLGEYTALAAAKALEFDDAVRLVRIRADAMQTAVPVGMGGMAAILGLSDDEVLQACKKAAQGGGVVEAVNFNAPAQVVIAGHQAAVERACEVAKEMGARRAVSLPVSAPFHSSLLKSAADVLALALNQLEVAPPEIPLINNVDVLSPTEPQAIKDALVRQSWHAVRWVETIQEMKERGVTHVVECGPGRVLTGLVKRIDRDLAALSINDPDSLQAALDALQG
ncbi:MAG TPA: ACP S-malonyltransferase [Burkholderiaceae bacterium]|nr:ACP S-malonyltransferase [Burkholderiaceae bacterium]